MSAPLLQELASLLDTNAEKLQPHIQLDTFANWDSLTKVTLIGFLIDRNNLAVDMSAFDQIRTVGDLLDIATPDFALARA